MAVDQDPRQPGDQITLNLTVLVIMVVAPSTPAGMRLEFAALCGIGTLPRLNRPSPSPSLLSPVSPPRVSAQDR